MKSENCPVCGEVLVPGLRPWHLVCRSCRYESSNLESRIVARTGVIDLDEAAREQALSTLRKRNFADVAVEVADLVWADRSVTRPRLLDVGCAHGWFMQACEERFDVSGIEPDEAVAIEASKRVDSIRKGFFPDVLDNNEMFDVIVFNDVLEHIPAITNTLEACNKHLHRSGLVVINAPCRLGAIYRTTKLMARLGWFQSFERMWQLDFPSPHVHYLDPHSVHHLASKAGFEVIKQTRLPSVSARGLYSRIRYAKDISRMKATILAAAVILSIPALKVLPSDIDVWYLRKTG